MANKTLSDFPVLANLDAASVTHVQKELVDYQVPLDTLTQYVTENAEYADMGNKIDGADEKTDPVDADMIGLMDSAASNILTKFSWANIKAKLKAYFDLLYPSVNGWTACGVTFTYASADAPTFTMTAPGDLTGTYNAGMKIKLTQTTDRYFFISIDPTYSAGTGLTTLTLYGGTDYTLDDAAISNVYYSAMKAPHGFPPDPAKWTVEVTDSSQYDTDSTTYVNLGSISITLPIGSWNTSVQCGIECRPTYGHITLSTSSTSESDNELTALVLDGGTSVRIEKTLSIISKTTYYLNGKTANASSAAYLLGGTVKTIIRAVCAYL